jgi:hypothetical protein
MSERTTAGPGPAEPDTAAEDAIIRPFRIVAALWPERCTALVSVSGCLR